MSDTDTDTTVEDMLDAGCTWDRTLRRWVRPQGVEGLVWDRRLRRWVKPLQEQQGGSDVSGR